MTREKIDIIFNSNWDEIGELYSTCDDAVFLNWGDALNHILGKHKQMTIPLVSNKIDVWYRESKYQDTSF